MSRKRLKANLIASTANKGILFAQQLALVPVFLHYWGAELYGSWLVLVAIPTFLSTANVGIGSAAATQITLDLGAGRNEAARQALLSGILLTVGIMGLILVGITFVPEVALKPNSLGVENSKRIILLMMGGVTIGMIASPFTGFYIAQGRAAFGTWIKVLTGVGQLSVVFLLLINKQAPWIVALGIAVAQTIGAFVQIAASRAEFHLLTGSGLTWQTMRRLFGKSMGFKLGALWRAFYFQGTIWLAAVLFGPVGAATWGTLRTLSRAGNQLLSLLNQTVIPEVKLAVAKGDLNLARRLHSFTLALTVGATLPALVILSLFGPWLYDHWTRGELPIPYAVWPVLGIGIVLNSLWWASAMIPLAYNQPWHLNLPGFVCALIAIGTVICLNAIYHSITVFPIGGLAFEGLMALVILRGSLKLLDQAFTDAVADGFEMLQTEFRRIVSRYGAGAKVGR